MIHKHDKYGYNLHYTKPKVLYLLCLNISWHSLYKDSRTTFKLCKKIKNLTINSQINITFAKNISNQKSELRKNNKFWTFYKN